MSYELRVKVYCIKDIQKQWVLEKISKLIDSCIMKQSKMRHLHEENKYKPYVFNSLYPIEKDGMYKEGNLYTFLIRTFDKSLAGFFMDYLHKEYSPFLKVVVVEKRVLSKKTLEKIFSITPMIMKFEEGYWRDHTTLEIFEKRIKENLVKKYNALYHTKIDEDFELFTHMRLDNKKPIAIYYKDICLLGDKVTLYLSSSSMAQELGWLAACTGLSELNARGYGFMNFRYV